MNFNIKKVITTTLLASMLITNMITPLKVNAMTDNYPLKSNINLNNNELSTQTNLINKFIKNYIRDKKLSKNSIINRNTILDYLTKNNNMDFREKAIDMMFIDYIENISAKENFDVEFLESSLKAYSSGENFADWGMNGKVMNWVSSDRDYEWYIDQGNTGTYSRDNCGPSVATMALKWANKDFNKNVEDARKVYETNGGWWYTNEIVDYLEQNGLNSHYKWFSWDKEQIKNIIDSGNLAIFCLNTYNLDSHYGSNRVGRFYNPSSGHFILIKGYVETTEGFYLEAYDPNSLGQVNNDNSFKGRNRYYDLQDLCKAMKPDWNYLISVGS